MKASLYASCRESGFNLVGTVSVKAYDARTPKVHRVSTYMAKAQSVVVIGTGGTGFWSLLTREERSLHHCIDRVTVRRMRSVREALSGDNHKIIFPFRSTGMRFSFRRLAEMAGFGPADTVLGILIHPEFGPWISIRALIITEAQIEPDVVEHSFDPCSPCDKPCISACPAHALTRESFFIEACGRELATSEGCHGGCQSRYACIYGKEHAYGAEEGRHRQDFVRPILMSFAEVKKAGS